MDRQALSQLERLGIAHVEDVIDIGVPAGPEGPISGVPQSVVIAGPKGEGAVELQRISELFVGTRLPPSFAKGPTPEYEGFFKLLEETVVQFGDARGRDEYDAEIERLYVHLRRRPDGTDPNPIFAVMQAAVRVYMSMHDVSRGEFEAVVQRLSRSAGRYKDGGGSRNYCRFVRQFL